MSATIHMFSENGLSFQCSDDEPTIWVRSDRTRDTVSIDLTDKADRAKLRAALDQADKIADKENEK